MALPGMPASPVSMLVYPLSFGRSAFACGLAAKPGCYALALRSCDPALASRSPGCAPACDSEELVFIQTFSALFRFAHPRLKSCGKTFILCIPLRYTQAFGRVELFIFSSLAARMNPCPDTSSRPKRVFPQPLAMGYQSCPDT